MFSQQETVQILLQLEVDINGLSELKEVLEKAIAQFTEEADQLSYKTEVNSLVSELQAARETATTANTEDAGLVRADVLEWSENKPKNIKKYVIELRKRLARLIGWECPICSVENIF